MQGRVLFVLLCYNKLRQKEESERQSWRQVCRDRRKRRRTGKISGKKLALTSCHDMWGIKRDWEGDGQTGRKERVKQRRKPGWAAYREEEERKGERE
jgi:hypothetical protein